MSKLLPDVLKLAVPEPVGVTLYQTERQIDVVPGSEYSNVAYVLSPYVEPLIPDRPVAQLRLSLMGDE